MTDRDDSGSGRLGRCDAALVAGWRKAMGEARFAAAIGHWHFTRRSAQVEPTGDWDTWLVMAGRGFGKTRTGAQWVESVRSSSVRARIALIAPTHHDARSVMLEGESGILAVTPPEEIRSYSPSKRQLVWMNGARAEWFSAEEPEALRGPQFHYAWGDEVARWVDGPKAWMNLRLALRRGSRPRAVLTTTPRPVPLIRELLADTAVTVTRGRTADNAAHLPAAFIDAVTTAYGGTRLGRQELDGELIEDVVGALWTREMIEGCRLAPSPRSPFGESPSPCEGEGLGQPSPRRGEGDCAPVQRGEGQQWRRVVIGVDPPASAGGDACGIVVVALGSVGRGHVLADCSVSGRSPEGWARAVVAAAEAYGADRVIAEANNGGDMVVSVLRSVEAGLPVKKVHASRGKVARAEPVASLYGGGRVVHLGVFPALEDEMCGMVAGGAYEGPGRSPDRADALVWALTELMLGAAIKGPRIRVI